MSNFKIPKAANIIRDGDPVIITGMGLQFVRSDDVSIETGFAFLYDAAKRKFNIYHYTKVGELKAFEFATRCAPDREIPFSIISNRNAAKFYLAVGEYEKSMPYGAGFNRNTKLISIAPEQRDGLSAEILNS